MTIDLYQLWQLTVATLNIHQGGFLRPQRTWCQWVNEISKELFREKVEQWEKSQVIDDSLALSFLHTVNVKLSNIPGQGYDTFAYPEDYAGFSTARFLVTPDGKTIPKPKTDGCDCVTGKCVPYKDEDDLAREKLDSGAGINYRESNVTKVDNQRWGSALNHRLKGPTKTRPYITQYDSGFKVAPAGMGVLVLDYLKRPTDAVFGYTLGVNDEIIYDAVASIQLEWTDMVIGEFISRIKKRYGSATGQENIYSQGEREEKS